MSDLFFARAQMAFSLGFHILFAVAGMAMPLFMLIAEIRFARTGNAIYEQLARSWAKGTAILFAVGAVSGTVLSFELGLLWPTFMRHAGPLIGMPFSLEGFAFFLEAIAIGVYLYGWNKVPRALHIASGAVVALSGLASGVFVIAVNAWMNTPRGFRIDEHGELVDVRLWDAFFTPAFPTQALHMVFAAYSSVAVAVLAIHAEQLRRRAAPELHRAAFGIALRVLYCALPLQLLSGDLSAKQLAHYQPLKLAAAEALFQTENGAPLALGGYPDVATHSLRFGLHVPKLLSFLATDDWNGQVRGLDAFPREIWPNVPLVHACFELMVGAGTLLLGLSLWALLLELRSRAPWDNAAFLRAASALGPLGLIAVEAGWMVTEVGRQPFVIYGVLRTRDAVTPMPHLWISFTLTLALYALLGAVVLLLIRYHVLSAESLEKEAASRNDGH